MRKIKKAIERTRKTNASLKKALKDWKRKDENAPRGAKESEISRANTTYKKRLDESKRELF